jgi:hypothetical protein
MPQWEVMVADSSREPLLKTCGEEGSWKLASLPSHLQLPQTALFHEPGPWNAVF